MEKIQEPELRFPEFRNDKPYKEFGFKDIFLFSTGKNIKQREAAPEFKTPCIRYGELYYMYDEVITEIINKTNLDESELIFSEGDEILLPSAGETPLDIGMASALTLKGIAIGRTINILKPKNVNVYSQIFVSYYINQKLRIKIAKLAKGVSISNVYNSDLKTLKINLPSLEEQQKIASFLTAIDKRIALLEKKKIAIERYKKSIIQKIFSQEIRFRDEEGKEFPEWEVKRLEDMFNFFRGSNLSKKQIVEEGTHFCIHYGELFTVYKEVINTIFSKTNVICTKSKKGDILMPSSDVTPFGLATASAISESNIMLGSDINILRPKTEINSIYMSYYINFSKNKIVRLITGTTVKHIYNRDIKNLKYKVSVSKLEQQKIASFLSALDNRVEKMDEKIRLTTAYKKGLMQKMFV